MAFSIGATTLSFGWSEDDDWNPKAVVSEQHAIGTNTTLLQYHGKESGVRIIKGLTKSASEQSAIAGYLGTTQTIVDPLGSASAFVKDIKWRKLTDIANPPNNISWGYEITLIKRP